MVLYREKVSMSRVLLFCNNFVIILRLNTKPPRRGAVRKRNCPNRAVSFEYQAISFAQGMESAAPGRVTLSAEASEALCMQSFSGSPAIRPAIKYPV